MQKDKEPQLGQPKGQHCTEVKLHNVDELVSCITAITKNSCDPEKLAKKIPQEIREEKTPANKKRLEARFLRRYSRVFNEFMERIPDNPGDNKGRINLSLLKQFVTDYIGWIEKDKNGVYRTIINPRKTLKGVIFVSTESTGPEYDSSIVLISGDEFNILLTTHEITNQWALTILIDVLSVLREVVFRKAHPENKEVQKIEPRTWGLLFANGAVHLINKNYRKEIRQIIDDYKVLEPTGLVVLQSDKEKWGKISERLDKVMGAGKSLSSQEATYRSVFYLHSILYVLIQGWFENPNEAIQVFNNFSKTILPLKVV